MVSHASPGDARDEASGARVQTLIRHKWSCDRCDYDFETLIEFLTRYSAPLARAEGSDTSPGRRAAHRVRALPARTL